MIRAFGMVLVPGMIFVFGLIYLVSPRYAPPSQAWANGVYRNSCCAPLTLRDGVISAGVKAAHYKVVDGKRGFYIEVDRGVSVDRGSVRFGGTLQYVFFNRNSEAMPAIHEAYALHLSGANDMTEYVFVKR